MEKILFTHLLISDFMGNKKTLKAFQTDGRIEYSFYSGWTTSGTSNAMSNLQLDIALPNYIIDGSAKKTATRIEYLIRTCSVFKVDKIETIPAPKKKKQPAPYQDVVEYFNAYNKIHIVVNKRGIRNEMVCFENILSGAFTISERNYQSSYTCTEFEAEFEILRTVELTNQERNQK